MAQKRSFTLSPTNFGTVMILLAALFAGSRPLFARWVSGDGLNSAVITLYQVVFGALIFGGFGFAQWERVRANKAAVSVAVLSGVGIGIGTLAYYEAVTRLPVATVTAIYFTTPAIVAIFETVIHRRWPRPLALLSIACVLIGCLLVIGPQTAGGEASVVDYLIAFVPPVAWSILLMTISTWLVDFPAWAQVGFISSGALVPTVLALLWWPPVAFLPSTTIGWWGLVGIITVSGLFSQFLTSTGVPYAGAERASVIGVFEMVTAVLIGWFIFWEPITTAQLFGVLFIIGAIFLSRDR